MISASSPTVLSANTPDALSPPARRWLPRRVLITAAAAEQPHTAEIIRRCTSAGVDDIELLTGNRLTGLSLDPSVRSTPAPSRPWPWWSLRRAR
jgi:hypothetical protein